MICGEGREGDGGRVEGWTRRCGPERRRTETAAAAASGLIFQALFPRWRRRRRRRQRQGARRGGVQIAADVRGGGRRAVTARHVPSSPSLPLPLPPRLSARHGGSRCVRSRVPRSPAQAAGRAATRRCSAKAASDLSLPLSLVAAVDANDVIEMGCSSW